MKKLLHECYVSFRFGHGNASLILALSNFLIIAFSLIIKDIIDIEFYLFAIPFLLVYIVGCILLGRFQLSKSYSAENKLYFEHNKTLVKLELLKIRIMSGTANQEEIKAMTNYLESILTKHNIMDIIGSYSHCNQCIKPSIYFCITHKRELCGEHKCKS